MSGLDSVRRWFRVRGLHTVSLQEHIESRRDAAAKKRSLVASAPSMQAEIDRLKAINAELVAACKEGIRLLGLMNLCCDKPADNGVCGQLKEAIRKAEQ